MIKPSCFDDIQALTYKPFTLDAFSGTNGSNALVDRYLSHDTGHSFTDTNVSGEHLWANPPFELIHSTLKRYHAQKLLSPSTTCACFLLPSWPAKSWQPLLSGMKKIKEYPPGFPLFQHAPNVPISKPVTGIKWPMAVYYDPPTPAQSYKAASSVSPCSMIFRGTVSGAPLLVATDSMASHCFIDSNFVSEHGIHCTPTHETVELADSSVVAITRECTIYLQIHGARKGEILKHRV